MIAADWFRRCEHEEENGEDDETAAVDERRRAHAQDARAREDEDDGDCAPTEAECGSDVSEGASTRGDAGGGRKKRRKNCPG
jgi:hypothetical protein